MDALIVKAREFARRAHMAQTRRYTNEPYFVHLEEVATIVAGAGLSLNAIAAAWLHDVIEDQGVLESELVIRFGQQVSVMVVALTDTPPTLWLNREMRKQIDRDRLAQSSPEAQSIKCADLISNTSTIVKYDPGFAKIYLSEKRAVLAVLTRAHPGLKDCAIRSLENAERELAILTTST